jgi:hypothetical protein
MEDEYATRSQTLPQVQNAQFSEEQSCDGRAAQNMRIAWSSRSKDGLGFGVDHRNVQASKRSLVQFGGGV